MNWAPRGGLKIGPSNTGGGSSSSGATGGLAGRLAGTGRSVLASGARCLHHHATLNPSSSPPCRRRGVAVGRGDSAGRRGGGDRRLPIIRPRAGYLVAAAPAASVGAAAAAVSSPLGKRPRHDYETPDLPSHAHRQRWLESQADAFDAVAAGQPTPTRPPQAAAPAAPSRQHAHARGRRAAAGQPGAPALCRLPARVWAVRRGRGAPAPSTRSTCPSSTTCPRSAWRTSSPRCTRTCACCAAAWAARPCAA